MNKCDRKLLIFSGKLVCDHVVNIRNCGVFITGFYVIDCGDSSATKQG